MSEKSRWKWIPVSERLPVNEKAVWATAFGKAPKSQGVAWYKNGKWHLGNDFEYWEEVVAWMPLEDVMPPEFDYDPIKCSHNNWRECINFDTAYCNLCQNGVVDWYKPKCDRPQ